MIVQDRAQCWLIDGHSMIYRALLRPGMPLTAPNGEPTRGTYTFCKMLFAMVDEHRPTYLAMATDAPRHTTWRRKIYPAYKSSRDKGEASEEIDIQLRRIKQIVAALGIPVIGVEGYEADDVIATMVHSSWLRNSTTIDVVICSRDKDLHQLVQGTHVRLYDPQDREWIDATDVSLRWGVPANKVVEIQTLMGDPTDCVPGVPGIGKVRARELIQKYGSVKEVVEAADELSPSVQRALASADLGLCRQLVELRHDVPLSIRDLVSKFGGFDMEAARPIFQELGFRAWV